jgi:hypothetical protein
MKPGASRHPSSPALARSGRGAVRMAHRLDDTRSGAVTDESTVAVPEDEDVAARIPLLRRRRSCWRWWLRSHRSEYGGAGGTSRARERRSGSQLTCMGFFLSSGCFLGFAHRSGPPRRASIPVLALEAQPPTGLPSRPTCRGAGPLQVLKTRGFVGDSRQAGPVRPVYNADQPITALKGTGIP